MKEKIKYAGASGNTPFGTKKKLLGLLLAVFMVLTLAPTTARADVATEKWTDFAAPDFAGGAGTRIIHIRLPLQNSLQSWRKK